jgi:CubicO group peptidase (beta-lactamase class C family)
VRHLLYHTSGIKAYTSVEGFERTAFLPTTHEEVVKFVAPYPLEFDPGEKWDYSNTGYYLLGVVIEKASGQSYADFLQKRIFTPLQMTSTRVNDEKAVIANRASGYTWRENTLQRADAISMTWPYAAGAIVSTVSDLAKWDAALYTERLLKKSSLDAMWTSGKLNNGTMSGYGFGWFVEEIGGQRALTHGGRIPGFESFMYRFPEERLLVVVLANQDGLTNPTRLAQGVLRHYNPALAPVVYTPIEDKEPQMTAMVKRVFEQAAEGKADATWFTLNRQL